MGAVAREKGRVNGPKKSKGKCVNVLKTSRDFDNWQIYVKATRVQCGPGVLRGRGTIARFVSLQTLGGGGLELPDTSLGIFILFNNCLFKNIVEMACWRERE